MSIFVYRGPVAPNSSLFYGRKAELNRLMRLCQGEVQAYAIVYGGRQTGKTSLLLQLSHQLPESVNTCRVDFQGLPGETTPQVYAYLAKRVASSLHQEETLPAINNAPGLIEFLRQSVGRSEVKQFVLLLEELGALPQTTREDLANVLRAIFTSRFDPSYRSLAKMTVVIAGSIELYELAATQVSTLHNICEEIHLPDLSQGEVANLVTYGLSKLGVPLSDAESLGQAIYHYVEGHPYLTQRLGSFLEAHLADGTSLISAHVAEAVNQLLKGDPLLRHLRRALSEQGLLISCQDLLEGHLRFSRLDEEMARLELLGLAGEVDGYWAVRNRLLAQALQDWSTTLSKSTSSGTKAEKPSSGTTYHVNISQGQGIVIGDQAQLANEADKQAKREEN